MSREIVEVYADWQPIEARKGIRATELDYLLGVHDSYRMGGIRFKRAGSDAFLDDNSEFAAPPWVFINKEWLEVITSL